MEKEGNFDISFFFWFTPWPYYSLFYTHVVVVVHQGNCWEEVEAHRQRPGSQMLCLFHYVEVKARRSARVVLAT